MKELAFIFGAYIGIGLLICIVLAFRKGKSPHAIKAIDFLGMDSTFVSLIVIAPLWPLWVFMQIMEQDTLEPPKEPEKKVDEVKLDRLIGRTGKTVTPMIPSGRIRLDNKDYEAISDDGKLDRNEAVEVFGFAMGTLKVRRLQPKASHKEPNQ